jgi:uncharacterized protein DUF998
MTEMRTAATRRQESGLLAAAGVLAVSTTVSLVAGLDVGTALTEPGELRQTISEYGLGTDIQSFLFTVAVGLLAAGSVAVLVSLVRRGLAAGRSAVTGGLVAWAAGLAVIAIFPKQDHSRPDTFGGDVHRIASLVAFVGLPVAAFALARRWRREPSWDGWARRVGILAGVSVAMAGPLLYAVVVAVVTGTEWWQVIPLGYVERGLLLAEVATMLAIGCWSRAAGRRAEPAGFRRQDGRSGSGS